MLRNMRPTPNVRTRVGKYCSISSEIRVFQYPVSILSIFSIKYCSIKPCPGRLQNTVRYCKYLKYCTAGWANTAVFRARYGYSSIQYQYLSIFSIKYCSIKVYFGVFRSISSEIRCSDTVLDTVSILLSAARDTDTPVILILQYSKNTVFAHPDIYPYPADTRIP